MPKYRLNLRFGWLSGTFKAASLIAVGVAGHMGWTAADISFGKSEPAVPYDPALSTLAREQTEQAVFTMREQARSICTLPDADLAVLRGVKIVFDDMAQTDNMDRLMLQTDSGYQGDDGVVIPIHTYAHRHDHASEEEYIEGSVGEATKALDSLSSLKEAGVPVLGYVVDDKVSGDYVGAIFSRHQDGSAFLALGAQRYERNMIHGVVDKALLDQEGFALLMEKFKAGALDAPGRYVVYKNPYTVNGEGWRVENVGDASAVERVKGHADTALKVPGGICLK